MKGIKTLGILLFGLIVLVAVWYYFNQGKEAGTLVGADRAFAVENIDEVQKIFLANRIDGTTTLLEKKGDHWLYNGKYRARDNAMENLLNTIGKIQMMYKPADAAVPNMLQDLATRGIKVEVYGEDPQEPLKVYYVGGGTTDERGTFIMMEDAEQPYVGNIPSWEGNIRFRYNLKGDEWRDRAIFRTQAKTLESLSVEYPKQREHSFRLEREGNSYQVKPYYDLQKQKEAVPSSGAIEQFLSGFEYIGAEAFRNDYQAQDSIRQQVPFVVFRINQNDQSEKEVRLFPIFPDQLVYDSKLNQYFGNEQQVERYFVDINGTDFLIAQHRVVKDVLWGYDFFFN